MSFLVLLLALLVEKFSALRAQVQRDGWWLRMLAALEKRPHTAAAPWLCLALLVLLPGLLLWWLLWLLAPVAHGWLALPVHLLVVVYSLGRGDVLADLGPFRDTWRRGDAQGAYLVAQRDLGLDAEEEGDLLSWVQRYLLWQAYQGFFAVIFWYALLGPVPVLIYRLLALVIEHGRESSLRESARQVRHAFDWLPARVLVTSFALVGNFMAVSRVLLHELLNWDIPAADLIAAGGRAAAEVARQPDAAEGVATLDDLWQLLVRSALLWYAGFAGWTLLL